MNTTQLECFMAVANFLNFSRAAQQLRITQPAVSHQINALEDELGVKLFHRTSKNVRPTQEGYSFMQYAGEILKLSELSKARMKECRASLPVRIGIGCRNLSELRLLQPTLSRLRAEAPQFLPLVRVIPFDSLENLLAEGDLHLIFSLRNSAPPKAKYRELAKCPVMCMCSPEHPLARMESVTPEQLRAAGRIAVCRPPICPPDLFAAQSQVLGDRRPDEILFCEHQEVLASLAAAGYAFALTIDLPNTRIQGLRYLPLEGFAELSFGAVYLPGEQSAGLRTLLTLLTEDLRPN